MVCYLVPYRYNHNLCGYMPFLHALPLHIHKYNIQAFDAYIKQQVKLVTLARLYDFILYKLNIRLYIISVTIALLFDV